MLNKLCFPVIFLVVIILASCYGPRKATEQLERANKEYPGIVSSFCDSVYPAVIVGRDTIRDSIDVLVDCPPATIDPNDYFTIEDTGIIVPTRPGIKELKPGIYVKQRADTTAKTKVRVPVTTYKETAKSTAEIQACESKLADANKNLGRKIRLATIGWSIAAAEFLLLLLTIILLIKKLKK